MKLLKSPWIRLGLLGLFCFVVILALQVSWDRSYLASSGIPRSFAPFGDEIRGSDGGVDYLGTLQQLLGPPPPPERNASLTVGILAASKEINRNLAWRKQFFAKVGGNEADSQTGRAFCDDYELAVSSEEKRLPRFQEAFATIWGDDQEHPEMAKWLDKYPLEIARLREASQMQWYCPLISTEPNEPIYMAPMPITQGLRTAGKMLSTAAFREAGRGDFDQAIANINAIYQLGIHARGPTLTEELNANFVVRMGLDAAGKILRNRKLEEAQLQLLADSFETQEPSNFFKPEKSRSERYVVLDILQKIERKRIPPSDLGGIIESDGGFKLLLGMGFGSFVDRGTVIQQLNLHFDSVGQWRRDLPALQGSAFSAKWNSLTSSLKGEPTTISGLVGKWTGIILSPKVRGKWFGEVFWNLGIPAIQTVARSEIILRQQRALLRLAIALERYELRHGAHPDSLTQLTPEFLPELPMDCFAESGSFGYQKLAQGFRLSAGNAIPQGTTGWPNVSVEFLLDRSERTSEELKK